MSSSVRPVHSGCSWVWWNSPGTTPAPSRHEPVVVDGLVAGEQPQEVALADAVRAEHGDPLAEPQLDVERVGQPVELELLDDDGALAGAGAAEADVDLLLADLGRPLVALVELAQPALGGLQLRRRTSSAKLARRRISVTMATSRLRSSSYHARSWASFSRRAWRASW